MLRAWRGVRLSKPRRSSSMIVDEPSGGNTEEGLDVSFGRRPAVHEVVLVDERKVLPLRLGEALR